MRNHFFIHYLIVFFVCSNINAQETDLSANYNIWRKGKKYSYQAIFMDEANQIITKENIDIQSTGKVWDIAPNQTLINITIDFSSADSLKLAPFPIDSVPRKWKRVYREGVIENEDKIWMHPIRSNQYRITNVAPFPEIKLPPEIDKKWDGGLFLYEASGSFEGKTIFNYSIEDRLQRTYDFGNLICWKITATSTHNRYGKSTAIFYFNEEYGFTEMNYIFFNKQTLQIKLYKMEK